MTRIYIQTHLKIGGTSGTGGTANSHAVKSVPPSPPLVEQVEQQPFTWERQRGRQPMDMAISSVYAGVPFVPLWSF